MSHRAARLVVAEMQGGLTGPETPDVEKRIGWASFDGCLDLAKGLFCPSHIDHRATKLRVRLSNRGLRANANSKAASA